MPHHIILYHIAGGAKLSGLSARELAIAQATKGFTDWSCPPGSKQRTFLPPIDDGSPLDGSQRVQQQEEQAGRTGDLAERGASGVAVSPAAAAAAVGAVPLAERAAKQWKEFALAFLVLLMMRHFLRRYGKKTRPFAPFLYINDHFTKTGSGQT
jgi:hypothetical protein